jgi:hypothetical protein
LTTQADCHRIANSLEDLAKLIRDGGPTLLMAADRYAAGIKAAAANPGSRPTGPNDLGERLMPPGEPDDRGPDDPPFPKGLKPADPYERMAKRIPTGFRALQRLVPTMVADLTASRTVVVAKGAAATDLQRVNGKAGMCEACFTADRQDAYQDGTTDRKLEAVVLETFTTNRLGEMVHEQYDLCRKCAVSAHGARAAARSAGSDWDPDEWMRARVERLMENIGAGATA